MVDGYYKALQAGSSVDAFFFFFITSLIGASESHFWFLLGFCPVLCACEQNIWSLAFVQSN